MGRSVAAKATISAPVTVWLNSVMSGWAMWLTVSRPGVGTTADCVTARLGLDGSNEVGSRFTV